MKAARTLRSTINLSPRWRTWLAPEFLEETWGMINRQGAGGIDGESIAQFESTLEQRLQEICERLKAGAYRAPPARRVEIPKGPGKIGTRPLGIPKAVARILEAIFGADFCDASYGYRPGGSPHDANFAKRSLRSIWKRSASCRVLETNDCIMRALRDQIATKKVSYVFEAMSVIRGCSGW